MSRHAGRARRPEATPPTMADLEVWDRESHPAWCRSMPGCLGRHVGDAVRVDAVDRDDEDATVGAVVALSPTAGVTVALAVNEGNVVELDVRQWRALVAEVDAGIATVTGPTRWRRTGGVLAFAEQGRQMAAAAEAYANLPGPL